MADQPLKKALRAADRRAPLQETPALSAAVHWTPSAELPIHRWFRYREGFSPELFNHFHRAGARLDPFCGCGTTLVESAKRQIPAYGVDINPLATFVARTKTRTLAPRDIAAFERAVEKSVVSYRTCSPAPAPAFPLLRKVFLPESLDSLLRLRTFIDEQTSRAVRDLLFLAWLNILEESSNVFKEGNGLKYRNKRRRPGKYLTLADSEWVPRHFGPSIGSFVERAWATQCAAILQDLRSVPLQGQAPVHVTTGSCLDEENLIFPEPIQLAVFSPPYANRFDYFEAFKVELWMGGFVGAARDLAALRTASMRSNLTAGRTSATSSWDPLQNFLAMMDPAASSVRMGIKKTLAGYFDDTRRLLQLLKRSLAPRATVAIVVGNSAYARVIIPTDALVAQIAEEEGYKVRAVLVARHLHVSSQQRYHLAGLEDYMRESVVVLEH